ncbi:unnamed protein product [Arabis nemorensis]|uniref:Fe2OG dioxygenase domain-containing protein n=1 Tax=Arabis nemorensis TaxID=586526 RepID=A0A565CS87_9BRAS|nr:unnamed protein product [Arabis nemorensis]
MQVINHGVPLNVLEEIKDGVRRFHEEDPEVKKSYFSRDSAKKKFDYNSNFDLYSSSPSVNWRDSITCYMTPDPPTQRLAGLRYDILESMDCLKTLLMICHYYPPCPQPDLTLGITKHSDNSFLTLLLQDNIGGLQILHQDSWVDVAPLPGALVINIGDF